MTTMISFKLKGLRLIAVALLLLCSIAVSAQDKPDTTINKKDIQTVQRNMMIIQQHIHSLHIDGILRDKLDNVYQQSIFLLSAPIKPAPKKEKH